MSIDEELQRSECSRDHYMEQWSQVCDENQGLCNELAALRAALEDKADVVSKALRSAWQLGQTYWQQADSESWSENKRSGATHVKFQTLVDETRSAILADVWPGNEALRKS